MIGNKNDIIEEGQGTLHIFNLTIFLIPVTLRLHYNFF